MTPQQAQRLAAQTMEYCDHLATFTQSPGIMDRRYLTKEHQQTNAQLAAWADESGLKAWQDAAGNQWLRLTSSNPQAKRIILGSHTDTVPNGGIYDGILGVVAPLVLLKYFAESGIEFDCHLDVVGFGDEEGTRFGATLLGSSAVIGKWQPSWNELCDESGESLAEALRAFGLDVAAIEQAKIDSEQVLAYVEMHIEQGPILEANNLAVASVKGIAGAKRYEIVVTGKAGHAGTVPMQLRNDPLVTVSEWIAELDKETRNANNSQQTVVATVGQLEVKPGAVNVIPGQVALSLDVRSVDDAARDQVISKAHQSLISKAEKKGLSLSWTQTHQASAVECDQVLSSTLDDVITAVQGESEALVSGAGHDAMVFADVVPTTMLFVRCKGGVSHHPDESVQVSDVAQALQVLCNFVLLINGNASKQSSSETA